MYDIFYVGDNQPLKEQYPFAQQVHCIDEVSSTTKMYWFVEANTQVTDTEIFNFRPHDHDQCYEHVWKWNAENYGGLRLIPVKESRGIKEVSKCVCKHTFGVLNTPEPGDYFDLNPSATHVWCVDPEYKIVDDIDWSPGPFEPDFIHSFHLRGQLEHKYPEAEGGIKLYPRDWENVATKYHDFLDAAERYPVLFVESPEDFTRRDVYDTEYVWLIDKKYQINADTLDFVPNPFEQDYIHNFKMPRQLTSKYPDHMGGIYLVPKNHAHAELKVHKHCPVQDVLYDVFYTNKAFTPETFEFYAKRATTDWFWVVDRDFDFTGEFMFVPEEHEQEYIHVFKVPGFLEYRYFKSATDLGDDSVAGIFLVNKNFDATKKKLRLQDSPIHYDVFYTEETHNYETHARKSRTDMFWLVNRKHQLDNITWLPQPDERSCINVFSGDIKLVPKDYANAQEKFQGTLTGITLVEFQKFDNEEQGRLESAQPWFWVIDPDVDVLPGFDFSYVPDDWDAGKTHIWQKLNPITGKQYDYGGVKLCPKEQTHTGRPKYITKPACSQKPFKQIKLSAHTDIITQLEQFAECCESSMFWAIDPCTKPAPDFIFDYYPTQWDDQNVHVFSDDRDGHTGVRLYPTKTFTDNSYTLRDIQDNSFEKLKLMPEVASVTPDWQVMYLKPGDTRSEVIMELTMADTDFIWTVDAEVETLPEFEDLKFMPDLTNMDKIHVWQSLNSHTGRTHSYSGVRLWPTSTDHEKITTEMLKTSQGKRVQYVKSALSKRRPYGIAYISYQDPGADSKFQRLSERYPGMVHVRDVVGIQAAHRAATELIDTQMMWVVDSDCELTDTWEFDYLPDLHNTETTHVWYTENPVTGERYGYGGVKLMNTQMVKNSTDWGLDFTTGLGKKFRVVPEVCGITKFNTDAYNTWRSAFRECVKLSVSTDIDAPHRLLGWKKPDPTADFVADAMRGVHDASKFVEKHKHDLEMLNKINDFEYLKTIYEGSNTDIC